jgi:hypothetical protein
LYLYNAAEAYKASEISKTPAFNPDYVDLAGGRTLEVPPVSDDLIKRVEDMRLGNLANRAYRKKKFDCPETQTFAKIFEILYWPKKLQELVRAVVNEVVGSF